MRFVCDAMLGKLARELRLLGCDAACVRPPDSFRLACALARAQNRVLLTRATAIRAMKSPPRHLFIRGSDSRQQLINVIRFFNLNAYNFSPFTRCIECNTVLVSVERDGVEGRVPEYVFTTRTHFSECPACHRIFWQGTHVARMQERLANLIVLP